MDINNTAESGYCTMLHLDLDVLTLSARTNKTFVIHDSLIAEIFAWLPVKSILRFRCVCKMWNSLTREKHFVDRHNETRCSNSCNLGTIILPRDCSTNYTMLHYYGEDYSKRFDISALARKIVCRMSNTCHGLVCVYNTNISAASPNVIHLVNPSINELVTLPRGCSYTVMVALVYDVLIHKYKVVRLFQHLNLEENSRRLGCQILTLGSSQTWRDNIGDAPPNCFLPGGDSPVVVGGTIICGICTHHEQKTALVFDIISETFDVIVLPMGTNIYGYTRMVDLAGYCCFYCYEGERGIISILRQKYLRIWLLKDCKNRRWEEHRINLEVMKNFDCNSSHWITLVSMRDREILLSNSKGRFYCYDLENGNVIGGDPMYMIDGTPLPYFETLVSPIAIQGGDSVCY